MNVQPKKSHLQSLKKALETNQFENCALLAKALLKIYPNSHVIWNILGLAEFRLKNYSKAEFCYKKSLLMRSDFTSALNNLGLLYSKNHNYNEAIQLFRKAIKYNSNDFESMNNLALALKAEGSSSEAIEILLQAKKIAPKFCPTLKNIGLIYLQMENLEDAKLHFKQALELYPQDVDSNFWLGEIYIREKEIEKAKVLFELIVKIQPQNYLNWKKLGLINFEMQNFNNAILCLKKAVDLEQNDAETFNFLGASFFKVRDIVSAKTYFEKSLEIDPNYLVAYNNLANLHVELKNYSAASRYFKMALEIRENEPIIFFNLGNLYNEQQNYSKAIEYYEMAFNLNPEFFEAKAQIIHLSQYLNDFKTIKNISDECLNSLGISSGPIHPFRSLSWTDNPESDFLRAKNWCEHNYSKILQKSLPHPALPPKKLRVAYFSADFRDFPGMHLMSGMFSLHDRSKFEIFAFSYGEEIIDSMRNKIISDVDHFFDVRSCSDSEIFKLARKHEIDIAIHRNGYTRDSRTEIFAQRVAPIQINYLGYPGTLGASFIDYIIADPVIVDDTNRKFFSEKIIYMPFSYQPNDNKRKIVKSKETREKIGLSNDSFVCCCFNNNYKIGIEEFTIWARLLKRNPKAVLWLYVPNTLARKNLIEALKNEKIDPNRLIFAEKLTQEEHLARHEHADLFLDTFNYNAHTTASDALWTGLPIVTKKGLKFSSRVASSLLTAIGLEELITYSNDEYESLIHQLINEPLRLKKIKEKLNSSRENSPLFDTVSYVKDFESGLISAYENFYNRKQPVDIRVKSKI